MFINCRIRLVITLAFLALSTSLCLAQLGRSSKQVSLKTFSLQEGVNSADISPDESLVAIERTSEHKTADNTTIFSEVVELWNFREDKVVATATLKSVDEQPMSSNVAHNPLMTPHFVRFSGEGKVVVVYLDGSITLLRASDLGFLRTVMIAVPPNITRPHVYKGNSRIVVVHTKLEAMEMSPTGTSLALLWVTGFSHGSVDFYDISTGQLMAGWEAPSGLILLEGGHHLAWDSVSPLVYVALPNATPCGNPNNIPDVLGVDSQTGMTKVGITTGLIVGDIAVTPGHELLAVDRNCVNVLQNHHPRMKVFDLSTGKFARNVQADGTGVRYAVSVSRDGQRAVAWTSDMRCQFDWLDMVCYDRAVKEMLTIWHLPDFSVVASAVVNTPSDRPLRMSSMGRYVLTYGKTVSVLELP